MLSNHGDLHPRGAMSVYSLFRCHVYAYPSRYDSVVAGLVLVAQYMAAVLAIVCPNRIGHALFCSGCCGGHIRFYWLRQQPSFVLALVGTSAAVFSLVEIDMVSALTLVAVSSSSVEFDGVFM